MNANTRKHIKGSTDQNNSFNVINTNETRKLLRHLNIPQSVISELVYKTNEFIPDTVQLNYRGDRPSDQASAQRGKIIDNRTGTAIVGGSTFTHMAIVRGNILNIKNDQIILDLVDENLHFIGRTISMPIPMSEGTRRVRYLNKLLSDAKNKKGFHNLRDLTGLDEEAIQYHIQTDDKLNQEINRIEQELIVARIESGDQSTEQDPHVNIYDDATGGRNLAHDIDVQSGSQTFIRYYSEGTHLYVYKFEGTVYFATHNNSSAGHYRDGEFGGNARFGTKTFINAYNEIGGPHPDKLFPDPDVLTSPFVFRFLVCTPEHIKNSRLIVNDKGYLVFVGIHEMWYYDSACPYSTKKNDVLDNRPYAGKEDNRSVSQLLDLNNMVDTSKIQVVSSLDDVPIDDIPIIYYPRASFDVDECNHLLYYGIDGNIEFDPVREGMDIRLGLGEAMMFTHYQERDGTNYITNVRVMSESYAYRLQCHSNAERNAIKDMSRFTEGGVENSIFEYGGDYINFRPFVVSEIWDRFMHPLTDHDADVEIHGPSFYNVPPHGLIKPSNNFSKRMIAANLYIYITNPKNQMTLIMFLYNIHMKIVKSVVNAVIGYHSIDLSKLTADNPTVKEFIELCKFVQIACAANDLTPDNGDAYDSIVYNVAFNNFSLISLENIIRYCELDWAIGADAINDLQVINPVLATFNNKYRGNRSLNSAKYRMHKADKVFKRGQGKKLKQNLQTKRNRRGFTIRA